jgi:hypothetical protein
MYRFPAPTATPSFCAFPSSNNNGRSTFNCDAASASPNCFPTATPSLLFQVEEPYPVTHHSSSFDDIQFQLNNDCDYNNNNYNHEDSMEYDDFSYEESTQYPNNNISHTDTNTILDDPLCYDIEGYFDDFEFDDTNEEDIMNDPLCYDIDGYCESSTNLIDINNVNNQYVSEQPRNNSFDCTDGEFIELLDDIANDVTYASNNNNGYNHNNGYNDSQQTHYSDSHGYYHNNQQQQLPFQADPYQYNSRNNVNTSNHISYNQSSYNTRDKINYNTCNGNNNNNIFHSQYNNNTYSGNYSFSQTNNNNNYGSYPTRHDSSSNKKGRKTNSIARHTATTNRVREKGKFKKCQIKWISATEIGSDNNNAYSDSSYYDQE